MAQQHEAALTHAQAWTAHQSAANGVWHVEGPHASYPIRTDLVSVWGGGGDAKQLATLIAAAPDMLAALKALMQDIGNDGDALSLLRDGTWEAACAAIARAEDR
jgi:hypothetical protein